MPRKRDYKAEYATRKARAQRAGYTGVREYSRTRKQLALPRNTSPVPKRILAAEGSSPRIARLRREAAQWSREHSRRAHSRYFSTLTDAQAERYWLAFVDENIPGRSAAERDFEKRIRIKRYLVPDFLPGEKEWETNPSTVPLRR